MPCTACMGTPFCGVPGVCWATRKKRLVLLSASSANEDAQESDALRGSFFTHHFVSALLGAADANGDAQVTLEEAYRYTYEGTLRSTSATWAGTQHPTFFHEIRGAGTLALTTLPSVASQRALLVFPSGRTYLVMDRSNQGAIVGEVLDVAQSRRISVRAGHYFVRGRAGDTLLEGEVDAPAGANVEVRDDRLRRVAYARLVRKGEGVRRSAHGPEAAYLFQTPLKNAEGLCHGALAGYALHLEQVSIGARVAACHGGFANDLVEASTNLFGGELRAFHSWDALPPVSVSLGLAFGGWVLNQSFTTRGEAPSRSTFAGSLALTFGLDLELGAGFSLFTESGLAAFTYTQQSAATESTSLGPFFAFRQAVGVSKAF
jgi:hypothetical protein